jgi:hypothetical protein
MCGRSLSYATGNQNRREHSNLDLKEALTPSCNHTKSVITPSPFSLKDQFISSQATSASISAFFLADDLEFGSNQKRMPMG